MWALFPARQWALLPLLLPAAASAATVAGGPASKAAWAIDSTAPLKMAKGPGHTHVSMTGRCVAAVVTGGPTTTF